MLLGISDFECKVVILFEKAASFEVFVTIGNNETAEAGTMFGEDTPDEQVNLSMDTQYLHSARRDGKPVHPLLEQNIGWMRI